MTAMPICLVVVAGVGATMTTFLGRAVVEQNQVMKEAAAERAAWRSIGEIELAKNVILNSSYTDGRNDAILAAIASDPPLIAGTPVAVEVAGPARWYRLSSTNDFGTAMGAANCLIRDGMSYTAYNYYVEAHNLGISGKPKGRIFTNKTLEFYFAGGSYDGELGASEGFVYKNGATAANTTFLRGADPAAASKNLLSKISFPGIKAKATYVAPANLVAEVALNKTTLQVKLYAKDSVQVVAVQKTRSVQIGTQLQWVTKTNYRYEWQWVNTKKTRNVWVDTTSTTSGGGTDLGGGGSTGYWKSETYYEMVWTNVKIANGTYQVQELVPIMGTETYWVNQNQTVAGALLSTKSYPMSGIFYFPGDVRKIGGDVNGKVTLVTESKATITGNLRYIDAQNDYAYLNGTVATGEYVSNPAFNRNHALGIIAKGDVVYSRSAPTSLEINANLISATGTIAMDGIVLSATGTPSLSGSASVKNSIRRFGSVMCLKRPVATLIDAAGTVTHGFKAGASVYDQGALNDPPPGFPNEEMLNVLETVRFNTSHNTGAGAGVPDAGVTALSGLATFDEVRDWTTQARFNWGATDLKKGTEDRQIERIDPTKIDATRRGITGTRTRTGKLGQTGGM